MQPFLHSQEFRKECFSEVDGEEIPSSSAADSPDNMVEIGVIIWWAEEEVASQFSSWTSRGMGLLTPVSV